MSSARRQRLAKGLGHSERLFLEAVWWPAFGHFDGLYPEYEVQDFKDGMRFIDFAYVHPRFRVAIELDGYTTHAREISAMHFSDQLMRQNALVIDGWYVLRFPTHDLANNPRHCQQTIQQLFGRLFSTQNESFHELNSLDREILRIFSKWPDLMGPKRIAELLHVSSDTASRHLRNLASKRWLDPLGGKQRVRLYRLNPNRRLDRRN